MATIDMRSLGAALGEGAALRQSDSASLASTGETHVYFETCEECKTVNLADCTVDGSGRELNVTMTLRNVCPGKRIAVGVTVTEMDSAGNEHPRGFRAITLPARGGSAPCDVTMPVTRFVLPEDSRADGSCGCGGRRHFVIRTNSQYLDTDTTM